MDQSRKTSAPPRAGLPIFQPHGAPQGGEEPHWVDLYTAAYPRCDCADHLWRDAICKHILAALIREGNERIIGAVGQLVAGLRAA